MTIGTGGNGCTLGSMTTMMRSDRMTEEQKKEAFIVSLAETIYDYFPEIWRIEYHADEEYNEEFIHITYANNCSRSICVTADSLKALMLDLSNYLIRH